MVFQVEKQNQIYENKKKFIKVNAEKINKKTKNSHVYKKI